MSLIVILRYSFEISDHYIKHLSLSWQQHALPQSHYRPPAAYALLVYNYRIASTRLAFNIIATHLLSWFRFGPIIAPLMDPSGVSLTEHISRFYSSLSFSWRRLVVRDPIAPTHRSLGRLAGTLYIGWYYFYKITTMLSYFGEFSRAQYINLCGFSCTLKHVYSWFKCDVRVLGFICIAHLRVYVLYSRLLSTLSKTIINNSDYNSRKKQLP